MAHLALRDTRIKPTVPRDLPRPWPPVTQADTKAVTRALTSGQIWGDGPQVEALEKEWADYCGVRYCQTLASGTAGLHAGLVAAGVGPGDEVLVPVYSFHSTASAVLHQNGQPVFVDIDPVTYTIDPAKVEAAITDRTRALIAVHLWGLPADMRPLRKICRKHGLLLIEDACQAHGASYRGKRVGALGDCASFSLNGSKNLPGGEGGLFTTHTKRILDSGAKLQMRVRLRAGRRYPAYSLGYNWRMHEMVAALVRSMLTKLDRLNRGRARNAEFLATRLARIPGLTPPVTPADRTHVYHMVPVRIDPKPLGVDLPARQFREKVEKALQAEGVKCHQWVDAILPAAAVYQVREGYGRGCPWTCPYAGREVSYPEERFAEDYPEALRMLDETTIVWHMAPPNGLKLMRLYAEAFEKVFDHLDEVLG